MSGYYTKKLAAKRLRACYDLAPPRTRAYLEAEIEFVLSACAMVAILAGHVWEKVFLAQGRLLEMSVDSAVNSSPFLSSTQRATSMFLRQEAENVTSIQTKKA